MEDESGDGFTLYYLLSTSDGFQTKRGFASLEELRDYVSAENMSASCDEAYATAPDGETIADLLGGVDA